MNKSILDHKIPTHIGLVFLCIILGLTIFLLSGKSFLSLRASPAKTPTIVRIANISTTSFTVSFSTASESIGQVSYGESKNPEVLVKDDREREINEKPHRLHYFTINNLKPNTEYFFNLISNNETYNDNGEPYTVKTSPANISSRIEEKIISGKVIRMDGSYPKEGSVYAQIGNSQLISTILNQDGSFRMIVKNLLTQDLQKIDEITDDEKVNLTIIGDGEQATASIFMKDAGSIPTITLSQVYNFTSVPGDTAKTATDTAKSTMPLFSNLPKSNGKLEILVPEKDQTLNDTQPEFIGNSTANTQVNITINMLEAEEIINEKILSDMEGRWKFRPDIKLAPGIYKLSVSAKNSTGIIEGIMQSFGINAEGSQFTDPSVAPTKPKTSPTQVPTVLPSATPIASPTITLNPSPTILQLSPSIQSTSIPSSQPSITPPGSESLVITIGFLTFITLIGSLTFLLSRI